MISANVADSVPKIMNDCKSVKNRPDGGKDLVVGGKFHLAVLPFTS